MTLREYLHFVIDTGAMNKIGSFLCGKYYKGGSEQAVCGRYIESIQDILQLEPDQTLLKNTNILVREYETVTPELGDGFETVIHVGLIDTNTKENYAIDLVPWEQIIDMPVQIECDIDVREMVAYILYEITFWGFTAEEIHKQIKKTKQSIAEIESGEAELYEWKDIQHEFDK